MPIHLTNKKNDLLDYYCGSLLNFGLKFSRQLYIDVIYTLA